MAMASPAFVGTRPQRTREPANNRDSNALRASVLDVALQLGIGTSRAVENLIFDSILEDDEVENVTTPPLTSASAAASDESWPSVPASGSIPANLVLPVSSVPNLTPLNSGAQFMRTPSEDSHATTVSRPPQTRKLRKARKDGYESVGGYPSDNSKKARDNQNRKKGSVSTIEAEYQSDGGYLSDLTKRGVDKKKKSTKKSRNPSDDGDFSDRSYLSEVSLKKKKTFFGLRSRSPSTTRKQTPNATPPPVPALPPTPLSISEHSARSPIPFNWPDSAPAQAAPDEIRDLNPPTLRKDWSPLPPSVIIRSTPKSLSVDTTPENLALSTSSHEIARYSPALPSTLASSSMPRPHKIDTHVPSAPHSPEQTSTSAPPALRPYGVRFARSARSDSLDFTFPTQQSPLIVTTTSEKLPPRPKTSPLTTSHRQKANPSPILSSPAPSALLAASPMPTQPDLRPFISPTFLSTPSPLTLTPSTSPLQRGASPALSEFSIVSSSDFIVPSPRPRFFEDLPPPSPPPTCPLPELPSYSQPTPDTKRGRQLPFPVRGPLPIQGTSQPIELTERTRQEDLQAHLADVQAELQMVTQATTTLEDAVVHGVHGDDRDDDLPWLAEKVALVPPSPHRDQQQEDDCAWPDDESVRPDTAQFYLYAPPGPSGGTGRVIKHPSPDVPDDERSTYTLSYSASPAHIRASTMTGSVYSDIHSYYFGEPDRDERGGNERLLRARFVDDDEASQGMRARLMPRADSLYYPEKIPPVPKIRPF